MAAALTLVHAAPSGASLYLFDRSENKFTGKGTVGCAIVGNAKTHQHQLLCYSDNKAPICTATISAANDFRYTVSQGPCYGSFTSDTKAVWSVSFRSEAEATHFAAQIGLSFWACQGRPPNNILHYDVCVGSGSEGLANGDHIAIRYTGWYVKENDKGLLCLGDVFDASPGTDKVKLQLGLGSLSHGLEAGLLGMKRDGRRVVVLPPARSDSPPQACVYLVDLCKVKRESSAASVSLPIPLPYGKPEPAVDEVSNSSFGSCAVLDPAKRDVLKRLSAQGGHPVFPGMDIPPQPTLSHLPIAPHANSDGASFSPYLSNRTTAQVPAAPAAQPPPYSAPAPPAGPSAPSPPPAPTTATAKSVANMSFEEFLLMKQQQAAHPAAAITVAPHAAPPPDPTPAVPLSASPAALFQQQQQQHQLQQLQLLLLQQQLQQSSGLGLSPQPAPVAAALPSASLSLEPSILTLTSQQRLLATNVDTVLERLSVLATKFDNLESHRIFKESGGSGLSGIALTTSISRIVSENEQMRSDLADRESKIMSLKDKLNDTRKKNEEYMRETQQLLEEKKTIAQQANESRLELEREVSRLREQVARANNERDDSARHLITVKKLLELSDEELQKCKARLEALDSSSQADHERAQELQRALQEEKGNRRAAQDRCSQLRDELQEEQAAHLRTQQAAEDRRRKLEAERDALQRQLETERAAAAAELSRLRQEMSESLSDRDKRVDTDKQRWLDEGLRRGQQQGLEEGRYMAQAALQATIDGLHSKAELHKGEADALRATSAVLQESLDNARAALADARLSQQRAESDGLKKDAELSHLAITTQTKIKSIMSTVYFRMDRQLRRGKQKQLRPKDTLAMLMGCIKEVTLQMMAGQLDHEDDEEEYDGEEDDEEDSPRPPLKMVQVLEPIFSSKDSEYDAMSQGGFSLGDCMSVDVEIASSVGGISAFEAEQLEESAEDTAPEPVPLQDVVTPIIRPPELPSAMSEGPSEIDVEPSETAPSMISSEMFDDGGEAALHRSHGRRRSAGGDSADTDPSKDKRSPSPKAKTLFEDSSEDEASRPANGHVSTNGTHPGPAAIGAAPVVLARLHHLEEPPLSDPLAEQWDAPPAPPLDLVSPPPPDNGHGPLDGEAGVGPAAEVAAGAAVPEVGPQLLAEDGPPPPVPPPPCEEAARQFSSADSPNAVPAPAPGPLPEPMALEPPAEAAPPLPPTTAAADPPEPPTPAEVTVPTDDAADAPNDPAAGAPPPMELPADALRPTEPAAEDQPPAMGLTTALFSYGDGDRESAGLAVEAQSSAAAPPPKAALRLFDDSDEEEAPPTREPPKPPKPAVSAPAAPGGALRLFDDDEDDEAAFLPPPPAPKPPAEPKPPSQAGPPGRFLFPDSDEEDAGPL